MEHYLWIQKYNLFIFYSMETKLELSEKGGIFTAYAADATKAGTLQFTLRDKHIMVITHTLVDPAFEGQGVGKALVQAGVAYAQEQGYKILPICSFAQAYISRKAEWQPLLWTE